MDTIQQFDYTVELEQALLWQFNTAQNIASLIFAKQNWYTENQTQFWVDWQTDVFNLATANDFGLAVWSIILGLPLFIAVRPDPPDKPIWGLADDDTFDNGNKNFDNGNFTNYQGGIVLTTEQKRIVLQLRYFQLATRGDVLDVNYFLNYIFGDQGPCYLLDGLNMTETYVFMFQIDPILLQVLQQYDVLSRPAAVGIKYIEGLKPCFGLADDDTFANKNTNFDNGSFRY